MVDKLVLYILMRSDMASMNPGKAVAQGSHAANQFVNNIADAEERFLPMMLDWQKETGNGFGTCIVLDIGSEETMAGLVDASNQTGLFAQIVHDPTYPIRDGEVVHVLPVNTCAFVFGHQSLAQSILAEYSLMA